MRKRRVPNISGVNNVVKNIYCSRRCSTSGARSRNFDGNVTVVVAPTTTALTVVIGAAAAATVVKNHLWCLL